jgi:hypothetical protein
MRAPWQFVCAAAGEPNWGESLYEELFLRQCRASFFGPSPTANLVGVEEGSLFKAPFFVAR